ncbi:MAG: Lrp/AsnC family transcriptional regulator [Haloechinothrix sp.]
MTSKASATLDELDRRIVAALQVDGRASWRKIAAVLREPERTVARHGGRLIDERLVVVTGLALIAHSEPVIVDLRCTPGTIRIAANSLARRPESTFTYVVTGLADCVAEMWCPVDRLSSLLMDELPGTPGLARVSTHPLLRYYRTVHEWQPGVLTPEEVDRLSPGHPAKPATMGGEPMRLSPDERTILRALARDGRLTHEELARLADVSEATARRRLEALRAAGRIFFRAVVEPGLLGLPVEALLWIRTPPEAVDTVGERIIESPLVRYAAAIMGPHQLLVDVTLPSRSALHEFVTRSSWLDKVSAIETSLVVDALKRSAVLTGSHRTNEFNPM